MIKKGVFALMVAAAVVGIPLSSQVSSGLHAQQGQQDGELELLPVQGNVYMLAGAGANITVQVDDAGIVLVDTGNTASAQKVLEAIRRFSDKPVRYIINTQYHDDHNGGNEVLGKGFRVPPAIISHENVLNRMSAPVGSTSPRTTAAWPTDTFFLGQKDLYNGEAIQIFYQPAQTDGDAFVVFRRSDVVSAGDIFMTTTYPPIDTKAGGTVNGIIEGLNRILDVTVPMDKQENGTLVVPGHGRICDEADVVEYRDMLTIVRDRVQDAVKNGMTLPQVKAAKLTFDFDPRYGASSGSWTTDQFITALYENLSAAKPQAPATAKAKPTAATEKSKK